MSDSVYGRWGPVAIGVGVGYLVIGLGFAALAGAASAPHARFAWRLLAYVVSALVFMTHVVHEQRRGSAIKGTVLHATAAVALGAFLLAAAANLHPHAGRLGSRLLLALVLWPALTAIPAAVAALVLASGLARTGRRA